MRACVCARMRACVRACMHASERASALETMTSVHKQRTDGRCHIQIILTDGMVSTHGFVQHALRSSVRANVCACVEALGRLSISRFLGNYSLVQTVIYQINV